MPGIALLDNPLKAYPWGSRTFIPRLMGKPYPASTPQAELWMGAHPHGTSKVLWEGRQETLSSLIEKDPAGILGKSTADRFSDRLPFLFKVLAASKPLSIQAHPNQRQAEEGYERENKAGIPINAPDRNYRDLSHKPEILCALTPFWALKGFRTVNDIRSHLRCMGLSAADFPQLRGEGETALREVFDALFTMNRQRQKSLVSTLVSAASVHAGSDPAFEWMAKLHEAFPNDPGVLGPILLNLIRLQPGEALSVAPGELHAYLEGAGVEVMANSDNVLRGGLTGKHLDPHELLRVLDFTPRPKEILHPRRQGRAEWIYPGRAEEFLLSRITLDHGTSHQSPRRRSVEIMICVEGKAEVSDTHTKKTLSLSCGASALVPASVGGYRITGACTLYKASVPLEKSSGSHGT